MAEPAWLADQFEYWRPHLASVAYGMLGSVSEAEDAVQQAWLRLGRSDADAIIDLRAWLTTVVGRICLDMLRARQNHRVDPVGAWLPEPLVEEPAANGPEEQAVMADSVGMALLGPGDHQGGDPQPGRRAGGASRPRVNGRHRWGTHEVLQESSGLIGPSLRRTTASRPA